MNSNDLPGGAIELIVAERQRQIEQEGWSADHDDQHRLGALAAAAACYALNAMYISAPFDRYRQMVRDTIFLWWPFDPFDWKPKGAIRDLVRAGALIAAEIDRLQRLEAASTKGETK